MSQLKATRRTALSRALTRALTLFTHGCEGHAVKDPNGIFVKQRRSDKNGAEVDTLHETTKVDSLKSVLNESAKLERFPVRMSSEQPHTLKRRLLLGEGGYLHISEATSSCLLD